MEKVQQGIGKMVGYTHNIDELFMLPTVKWKHQRKHHVSLLAPISTFAERYTILAMRVGLLEQQA